MKKKRKLEGESSDKGEGGDDQWEAIGTKTLAVVMTASVRYLMLNISDNIHDKL